MRLRTLPVLVCAAALLCGAADNKPVKTGRKTHIRLGEISVGVGYARYGGYPYRYPYWYGPAWSYWGPYWSPFWDPFYSPFYYPGYRSLRTGGPNMGQVRLSAPENAEVYLDGAYAGPAKDLKTMWLEPGAYDLEVRTAGGKFDKRIYVLSGKRLELDAREAGQ